MNASNIYTYSGMVTQDEFKHRLGYFRSRIALGYTQEEISFLMGKHPYFYGEYEEMRTGTSLSDDDESVLLSIVKIPLSLSLNFERDDFGYQYQRLIKGYRETKGGLIYHKLVHPWLTKLDEKKKLTENKPVRLLEIPFVLDETGQTEALKRFEQAVERLIRFSYFNYPRLPLDIYERIKNDHYHPFLRPTYLKQVLYVLLAKKELQMKTIQQKIHYHSNLFTGYSPQGNHGIQRGL